MKTRKQRFSPGRRVMVGMGMKVGTVKTVADHPSVLGEFIHEVLVDGENEPRRVVGCDLQPLPALWIKIRYHICIMRRKRQPGFDLFERNSFGILFAAILFALGSAGSAKSTRLQTFWVVLAIAGATFAIWRRGNLAFLSHVGKLWTTALFTAVIVVLGFSSRIDNYTSTDETRTQQSQTKAAPAPISGQPSAPQHPKKTTARLAKRPPITSSPEMLNGVHPLSNFALSSVEYAHNGSNPFTFAYTPKASGELQASAMSPNPPQEIKKQVAEAAPQAIAPTQNSRQQASTPSQPAADSPCVETRDKIKWRRPMVDHVCLGSWSSSQHSDVTFVPIPGKQMPGDLMFDDKGDITFKNIGPYMTVPENGIHYTSSASHTTEKHTIVTPGVFQQVLHGGNSVEDPPEQH